MIGKEERVAGQSGKGVEFQESGVRTVCEANKEVLQHGVVGAEIEVLQDCQINWRGWCGKVRRVLGERRRGVK